jgi:hypothetical protein
VSVSVKEGLTGNMYAASQVRVKVGVRVRVSDRVER